MQNPCDSEGGGNSEHTNLSQTDLLSQAILRNINEFKDNCSNSGSTFLPFGWQLKYDDHGRRYYIDHATKSTTWNAPQKSNLDIFLQDLENRVQTIENISQNRILFLEDSLEQTLII